MLKKITLHAVYAIAALAVLVVGFDAKAASIENYGHYKKFSPEARAFYLMGVFDGIYFGIEKGTAGQEIVKAKTLLCIQDLKLNADLIMQAVERTYEANLTLWHVPPVSMLEITVFALCNK
tara:strand:+ start:21711 stop:22073 length:363 start_codon:yes stop_codon:yes gene_type:complete